MASEDETQSPDGDSSPHVPNVRAYGEYIAILDARLVANSEAYDRALLTLSSAFLLVSMSFISDVVDLAKASHLWLLCSSWVLLVASILTVVFSFPVSNSMGNELRERAKPFFLKGEYGELKVSQILSQRMDRLNWATGVMFAIGVVALTMFQILNVPTQETEVDKREIIERGMPLPSYDQVPSAVPQQQPQQQQTEQPSQSEPPRVYRRLFSMSQAAIA